MNETIPAINRLGAARRGAARRFHERTLDSAPELSRSPFQFQDILNPFSRSKKRDCEFSWEKEKLIDYRFPETISILLFKYSKDRSISSVDNFYERSSSFDRGKIGG